MRRLVRKSSVVGSAAERSISGLGSGWTFFLRRPNVFEGKEGTGGTSSSIDPRRERPFLSPSSADFFRDLKRFIVVGYLAGPRQVSETSDPRRCRAGNVFYVVENWIVNWVGRDSSGCASIVSQVFVTSVVSIHPKWGSSDPNNRTVSCVESVVTSQPAAKSCPCRSIIEMVVRMQRWRSARCRYRGGEDLRHVFPRALATSPAP